MCSYWISGFASIKVIECRAAGLIFILVCMGVAVLEIWIVGLLIWHVIGGEGIGSRSFEVFWSGRFLYWF